MRPVTHQHKWKRFYTRGFSAIGFRCACGKEMERKATPAERRRIKADDRRQGAETERMHRVHWDFGKTFRKNGSWKYKSYELMTRVRKWAEKWPKDVIVCRIDDSYNASSDLVFILHRIGRKLWGTTCYTITQCDGQPPNEWFMYPGHRKGIQEALQAMSGYKSFYKGL